MKNVLIVITCLLLPLVFWAEKKRMALPSYKIVSDSLDNTIPDGKCKISGLVYYKAKLHKGAEVRGLDASKVHKSNKNGEFSFLIDTSETGVYAFINENKTIYIENYVFKNQHHVSVIFRIGETRISNPTSIVKKPVIYAYSEDSIEVSLALETKAELTFTYPKYQGAWRFSLKEDKISTSNDNLYPYLFWEGEMKNLNFQHKGSTIEGFKVKSDNQIEFLEKQLSNLGLNATETTDFITFWGPQLYTFDEVFIQFLIDEEYEIISSNIIYPKPDNQRRVYILFCDSKDLPKNLEITSQKFNKFNRSGFTIVEWGGSEIVQPSLSEN